MKVYTFETTERIFEFYDIRKAKKKAIEVAINTQSEILVTCLHKTSYKQDWYTALPDGRWLVDLKGFRADN
jgi:hypothetical protein